MEQKDLIIVGAGPVGIYAAYIAGLRGLKVTLLEGTDKPGGQATHVFGKKNVYDMPGLAALTGDELIQYNLDQLATKKDLVELQTNQSIESLEHGKDNLYHVCTKDKCHVAKSVILATGNGIYKPRPWGIDYKEAKNVLYTVTDFAPFKDKEILVFGGGDSALDWANMVADNGAKKVTLVHRREEFRAKADSVTMFENKSNTEILKPFSPDSVEIKNGLVTEVTVKNDNETKKVKADFVIVNFGAQLNTNLIKLDKELELEKGRIKVNGWCKTNVDGVWAIGNSCTREGKVTVIVSGYGEAVSAVASVATYLDPKASPTFLSSLKG